MDRLKRSVKKIAVESSLVCAVICVLDAYLLVYLGINYYTEYPALVFLLFSIIYYSRTVQEGLNKLLFVFFTVTHLAGLVGTIRIVLRNFFLYDYFSTMYDSATYIALCDLFETFCTIVFYPVVWFVMFYWFTPRLKQISSRHMRGLWLVPMAFFVLLMIMYPFYDYITTNQIIIILIGASSVFVLVLILRTIEIITRSSRLETENQAMNHQLELQREHYRMIRTHIDETKRARHDLRHHLSVFQTYIETGETGKLADYIDEYKDSLPDDTVIEFCGNFAVNSILRYYTGIARSEGIQIDVHMELPEKTGVSDSDLCIIIGNCVENAIEACRKLDEGKYIKIHSKLKGKMLTVIVANSYDGSIKKVGGSFMSLKHEGEGLGISSVKAVVDKYGESAQFETGESEFRATIILRVNA